MVVPGEFLVFGALNHEGRRDGAFILDRQFGCFLSVHFREAKIDNRMTQFENWTSKIGLTGKAHRRAIFNFEEEIGQSFASLLTFYGQLHVN